MSDRLTVLQLYPRDMNIYGDWGNALTVAKRAQWRGYDVEMLSYDPGDSFPDKVDIIVGGGGQDSGQSAIKDDLLAQGERLRHLAEAGVPMLAVCGLYQLFGHAFRTNKNTEIAGIGILDVNTVAGPSRLIGNIVTESPEFGTIVGYENHSGLTTLGPTGSPLATVRSGAGNNGTDGTEGARAHNVIGTYLHGSVLPKNPRLADFLIKKAAIAKFGEFRHEGIDDSITDKAREIALTRPR